MTDQVVPIPLTRPSTGGDELAALAEVLASGWLAGQGPRGTELEAGFRDLTGRAHAIAVNNCTAGLHLALRGLGVGPGDEVLVADYTFPATGHAVLYCGGVPRFVDVRSDTGTIDPDLIDAAVTPRTRGIIAVDALGVPADWDPLTAVARERSIFLLEDAACSTGGTYNGRPCGSFGDAAVFSLHARKGVTSGEGGVIVTDDDELAAKVRSWSAFGMRSAFERQNPGLLDIPEFTAIGYNYKLSDILAALGVVQLSRLDEFLAARRGLATRYAKLLEDIPGVQSPTVPADRETTWQTYAITLGPGLDRDRVVLSLRNQGIGSTIGTYSLHEQPVYGAGPPCPVSSRLYHRQVALPMFPELTHEDQDRVVAALRVALADQA